MPIPISSHPNSLAWSQLRLSDDTPAVLYGFLTLDETNSKLLDHRVVQREKSANPTGGPSEYLSDMETRHVTNKDIDAVAMTEMRAVIVRSGQQLFELDLKNEDWSVRVEIIPISAEEEEQ